MNPTRLAAAALTLAALTGCATTEPLPPSGPPEEVAAPWMPTPGSDTDWTAGDDSDLEYWPTEDKALAAAADRLIDPEEPPATQPIPRSPARCEWSPTMNYDWHDDYVCGGERQYFIPWDDYVERWELDAAAAEWEAAQ